MLEGATAILAGTAGSLDPTFQPKPSNGIKFILPLQEGLIAGGDFSDWEGTSAVQLVKLDHAGKRDSSFTPEVDSGLFLFALAQDSEGRLLVAGDLPGNGNTSVLYRLLPNGQRDPAFNVVTANNRIASVLTLPDSQILLGGFFTSVNGEGRAGIARLQATGALDGSFTPTAGGLAQALAVTAEGDYLASGNGLRRYSPEGTYEQAYQYGNNISFFARDLFRTPEEGTWVGDAFNSSKILADRGVDLSYTNRLWPSIGVARVLPDGRILLAGQDPANGLKQRFVRLFADGIEDTSFNAAVTNRTFSALAFASDEMAYVAGRMTPGSVPFLDRVFLQDDSAPTTILFNRAFAAVGEGNRVVLTILRDGDATGSATVRYATKADTAVAPGDFIETSGTVTFAPGERSKSIEIETIGSSESRPNRNFRVELSDAQNATLGVNTAVLVTIIDRESMTATPLKERTFSEISGTVQLYISRTGSLAYPEPVHWRLEPFNPATSNLFDALEGDTYFQALSSDAFINLRIRDDDLPETNKLFNLTFSSTDPRLTVTSDTDILVTVLENDRPRDPGRGTDDRIDQAAFYPDGKLAIGGSFLTVNGTARPQLARLFPTGEIDFGFAPPKLEGPIPVIRGLVPMSDGKLVVMGSFTNVLGSARNYLIRLNQDGSLDESFDASSTIASQPIGVAAMPDSGLVVLGFGSAFNGISSYTNKFQQVTHTNLGAVVRLQADGAKDTNFVTGTSSAAGCIVSLQDGRFMVAGDLAVYTNTVPQNVSGTQPARRYLARFLPSGAWDTNFNAVITIGNNNPSASTTATVTSLSVGTNEDVLMTGNLASANGVAIKSIAHFNSDGSLDQQFTTNAAKTILSSDAFISGTLSPTGQALLATQDRLGSSFSSFRLNSDGSRDRTFPGNFTSRSVGYTAPIWASASSGVAVLANTPTGFRLAWFYPDGTRAGDTAMSLRAIQLQPTGDFQVRVDGRTTGTLRLEGTTDFSKWEEVISQPLTSGLQTVIIPGPIKTNYTFFRGVVL
jgi:uncharacterized delta-60 repeat protein